MFVTYFLLTYRAFTTPKEILECIRKRCARRPAAPPAALTSIHSIQDADSEGAARLRYRVHTRILVHTSQVKP